ncbi:porin [Sphingomonas naphthae]|uniref:Porin n=1 Tax=Sphingomonas naphthae TaxID=1813468 RepID=A0ABY7TJV1_9SPHN|nr:porin [Sphingomonas naphthae]WCT73208.1 porin [Sphingomonas naphthae]
MRGKHKRLFAATAGLCLLANAAPAFADTTDDLLLRLKEKGILTEQEYQALLTRRQQEASAVVTTGTAPAPQQAAAQALDDKRSVRMTESGVGFEMGGVQLKFSGSVNGFYVHDNGDSPTANHVVAGGLATVGPKSSSVRNGLLPGFLKVDVTTNQGGWDVGAHFGMYPGIDSVTGAGGANSGGAPQALATAGIDFRQTYLTFGKPNFGEVKIGRDIGLFASEAILNDITLLSVGTAAGNAAPSNTSLGRIGLGYIYTDFQPQMTYTTPKFGGLQASIGLFQPLVTIGNNEVNKNPGFQGKVTYDFTAGKVGGHLWLSGITQKHDGVGAFPSYTGRAVDGGAKLTFGPASLLGYYYTGKGIGTTGLFILSTAANGRSRKSDGFYTQGTLTFGKLTAGVSYGESRLDLAPGEVNPILVDVNSSWVGQLRYGLTPWVTLVSEYVRTKSEAHGINEAKSNALAAGAILFF